MRLRVECPRAHAIERLRRQLDDHSHRPGERAGGLARAGHPRRARTRAARGRLSSRTARSPQAPNRRTPRRSRSRFPRPGSMTRSADCSRSAPRVRERERGGRRRGVRRRRCARGERTQAGAAADRHPRHAHRKAQRRARRGARARARARGDRAAGRTDALSPHARGNEHARGHRARKAARGRRHGKLGRARGGVPPVVAQLHRLHRSAHRGAGNAAAARRDGGGRGLARMARAPRARLPGPRRARGPVP